jgi:hypothetical protein
VKRSLRPLAIATALLVGTVGAAVGLTSANAVVTGTATLTPANGTIDSLIRVDTSGPCVAPATRVQVRVFGFGFAPTGQVTYSPQAFGFSTTEPMSLQLSNSFFVYATNNSSTPLVGAYDVRVQCVNNLATVVYDEFQTTMNWTTPGNSFANIAQATYTSGAAPTTSAPPTTTAPPTLSAPARVTSPTISGTAKVGLSVTCNRGTWTNSPTAYAYQWFRSGTAITGATSNRRTLNSNDYAKTITCRVTASNAAGSASATSSGVKVALGTFKLNTSPAISGTAKVGRTLSVSRGSWTPTPKTYQYQWYRNGVAITGATKNSYTVKSSDRGRTLTARVTVFQTGYAKAWKTTSGKKAF